MPFPVSKRGLHLQPAGTYLRAFCKGNWEKLPERYKEILAYAKKQGTTLCGYAYETGINELVIDSIDNKELMTTLIRVTCDELPNPRPRKKK